MDLLQTLLIRLAQILRIHLKQIPLLHLVILKILQSPLWSLIKIRLAVIRLLCYTLLQETERHLDVQQVRAQHYLQRRPSNLPLDLRPQDLCRPVRKGLIPLQLLLAIHLDRVVDLRISLILILRYVLERLFNFVFFIMRMFTNFVVIFDVILFLL